MWSHRPEFVRDWSAVARLTGCHTERSPAPAERATKSLAPGTGSSLTRNIGMFQESFELLAGFPEV